MEVQSMQQLQHCSLPRLRRPRFAATALFALLLSGTAPAARIMSASGHTRGPSTIAANQGTISTFSKGAPGENLFLIANAIAIGPATCVAIRPASPAPATIRGRESEVASNDAGPLTLVGAGFSLAVFDGSDQLLSTLQVDHPVLDVTVRGETAYLACKESGVLVIDLADPAAPTVTDALGVQLACAVGLADNHLCAAGLQGGLTFYDLDDPRHPTYRGYYYTWCFGVNAVAGEGDLFYMVGDFCPLTVIDASDPSVPVEIGSLNLYATGYDVTVEGGQVLVAAGGGSGFRIIDALDPTDPRVVATLPTENAQGVRSAGDYAYVADMARGLVTIDISNPEEPLEIDLDPVASEPQRVALGTTTLALAAGGGGGVHFFDRSEPAAPEEKSRFRTADEARGIDVASGYAYVADRNAGLLVLDLSNPAAPLLVGEWHGCYRAESVTVDGDYAYLCDPGQGLFVFDISDPTLPIEIGHLQISHLQRVVVGGNDFLYAAASNSGFFVLDIADPTHPMEVHWLDISVADLVIQDELLYASGRDALLTILDISIPSTPFIVGVYDDHVSVGEAVAIDGDVALASGLTGGLYLIDVSDPSDPREISEWGLFQKVYGMDVGTDGIYLARGIDGYSILDISTPTDPIEIAYFDDMIDGRALDIVASGTLAITADGVRGALILNPILGRTRCVGKRLW
jgi:hypothetical protein